MAEDSSLGRRVWLHIRRPGAGAVSEARKLVSRPSRPRWLTSGADGDCHWEAFVAPAGTPLPALVESGEPFSWKDARHLLDELSGELTSSWKDGTLPRELAADQVWVGPGGAVQLIDEPLGDAAPEAATAEDGSAEARALRLLRQVAILALEGRAREESDLSPLRAPLPLHASAIVDRLLGGERAHTSVEGFRGDLAACRDRLAETPRGLRAAQLALELFALVMATPVWALLRRAGVPAGAGQLTFPLFWVLWAWGTAGGITLPLLGMTLVRNRGGRAGRLRCGLRALVVWGPVAGLIVARNLADEPWEAFFSIAILLLVPLYFALGVIWPCRSLHDRIAGTWVVPL